MEYKIKIVGIGPGSTDYILPVAQKTIEQAKILVGSKRALSTFATNQAETIVIDKNIKDLLLDIRERLKYSDVVVMVSGDPGFYSLLSAIRTQFKPEQITVIPGISSLQLAFARIGDFWHDAVLLSMHGRSADERLLEYSPYKKLGILTDDKNTPAVVAGMMLKKGWPPDTKITLCANLSYDNEMVITKRLEEISDGKNLFNCVMVVSANDS